LYFLIRWAPFPFRRSEDLFIYSQGASKVGTEVALFFYCPVPVPNLFIHGPPSQPGTGTEYKKMLYYLIAQPWNITTLLS